jgi:hypothetical protein
MADRAQTCSPLCEVLRGTLFAELGVSRDVAAKLVTTAGDPPSASDPNQVSGHCAA